MRKAVITAIVFGIAQPAIAETIRLQANQSVVVEGEPSAMIHFDGFGGGFSQCFVTIGYEGFKPFRAEITDDDSRMTYPFPEPLRLNDGTVIKCKGDGTFIEVSTAEDALAALKDFEDSILKQPSWATGINCGTTSGWNTVWGNVIGKVPPKPRALDTVFVKTQKAAANDTLLKFYQDLREDASYDRVDDAHSQMCKTLAHMAAAELTPEDLDFPDVESLLQPFRELVTEEAIDYIRRARYEGDADGWMQNRAHEYAAMINASYEDLLSQVE